MKAWLTANAFLFFLVVGTLGAVTALVRFVQLLGLDPLLERGASVIVAFGAICGVALLIKYWLEVLQRKR